MAGLQEELNVPRLVYWVAVGGPFAKNDVIRHVAAARADEEATKALRQSSS